MKTSRDGEHAIHAFGVLVGMENASIRATGSWIKASGEGSDGLVLRNSDATIRDTDIVGARYGIAFGPYLTSSSENNTFSMSGGSVTSIAGAAIHVDGGVNRLDIRNGARIIGGNGVLLDNVVMTRTYEGDVAEPAVISPYAALVSLTADGNVTLLGDARSAYPGHIDISLANNSEWTGAAHGLGDVTIDSSSVWKVTGDSGVAYSSGGDIADPSRLDLRGHVVFTEPFPLESPRTLRVRGDLVSHGGVIALNAQLGGPTDGLWSDRVLVDGNAEGTTALVVTPVSWFAHLAVSAVANASPASSVSLAQVAGGANASSFILEGGYLAAGAWRYELVAYQPGASTQENRAVAGGDGYWDYRLQPVTLLPEGPIIPPGPVLPPDQENPDSPEPTPVPAPGNREPEDVAPPAPIRHAVVPQVPSYLSASTALLSYGLRSVASLHDRLGELHGDDAGEATVADEFFARTFGGNYQYHSDRRFADLGYGFEQKDRGIQLGGTWLRKDSDSATWRLGLYAGTGTSRMAPRAIDGASAMRVRAGTGALTGTYVHATGFYVDGTVARSYYDTRVETPYRGSEMARMKTHGWTYALESGYPFQFANGLRIEPQAQVVYQSLRSDSFSDADHLQVAPGNTGAWLGRVGLMMGRTFTTSTNQHWSPSLRLNYRGSADTRSRVALSSYGISDSFATGAWGQAWQVGAGVTGSLTSAVSVFGQADYQGRAGNSGQQGWSANLGMRWQF
ncbi:autotransporter outer membrane beta-barrel domain-containing protein [Dyella sp. ASV21]|uniref:autotransporter family protein n=1 Tax=Dyella sp. ASV21 TaxID=2795114 RepID=UPI0031B871D3